MPAALAIIIAIAVAAIIVHPKSLARPAWRATATPLASIIGSGFLVSAPLLARQVGVMAPVAMAGLLAASIAIGAALRYIILHGEALVEGDSAHPYLVGIEHLSHLALALAYFVSVAFYVDLLGLFALKWAGIDNPTGARLMASAILAAIGGIGLARGLAGVERVEIYAVAIKLAIIAGFLAALAVVIAAGAPADMPPAQVRAFDWHGVRILLGLLLVVQGFETSRFLGQAYPAAIRARTMLIAQLIAAAIYISFFVLMIPFYPIVENDPSAAAIIDVAGLISPIVATLLMVAAMASQLSAATADSIAAAGLIANVANTAAARRLAYPVIATIAITLIWSTNVEGVIALASRAFALYYALQCLLAAQVARLGGDSWRTAAFSALALLCLCVLVFGIPASE